MEDYSIVQFGITETLKNTWKVVQDLRNYNGFSNPSNTIYKAS